MPNSSSEPPARHQPTPARGKRAFFLGAGASKGVGLPVTDELWHAVAFSINDLNPQRELRTLRDFVVDAYGITQEEIGLSAQFWRERFIEANSAIKPPPFTPPMPLVPEMLGTIDVLVTEGGILSVKSDRDNYRTRELSRVREQIVRALGHAFRQIRPAIADSPLERLVKGTSPEDVFITTNWDLFLDQQFDRHFGTAAADTGTDAVIVRECQRKSRAKLLKLHGSFNWLCCGRCTKLYIDPQFPISTIPEDRQLWGTPGVRFNSGVVGSEGRCSCDVILSPVLIAPSYIKDYRSRHLGNIWATALQALAESEQWIFGGYSLPEDDLHIRVLLQKAVRMRKEPPVVTVANPDPRVAARLGTLLRPCLRSIRVLPSVEHID
jgi:hypothetical protein